jgi:hypothetical protein
MSEASVGTAQYLRFCNVTVGGAASAMFDGDGLRIRFEINQWTMQAPNLLKLIITNPAPNTAQKFTQKEYMSVQVDAGYVSNHGIIFQGDIKQSIYGRESPTDTIVTVYAADTDHAHNYATVNTTFPPGSTPQQHFNAALQAMQPYGISQGYIGVDLSTPVYPRAVTLWGMARDVLATIAESKKATVSYQQQKIQMLGYTQSLPGSAIVLNSTTGLIGVPTQTLQGIMARCLINPAIKIGTQVQINQKDVIGAYAPIGSAGQEEVTQAQLPSIATDGFYTVYKIDATGDTRGNPWYQDLTMLATGTQPTPAQSSLIPYL